METVKGNMEDLESVKAPFTSHLLRAAPCSLSVGAGLDFLYMGSLLAIRFLTQQLKSPASMSAEHHGTCLAFYEPALEDT